MLDELVLERLAQAVAIRSVQDDARSEPVGATSALLHLLTEDLEPDAVDIAVTRAGLDPRGLFVPRNRRGRAGHWGWTRNNSDAIPRGDH